MLENRTVLTVEEAADYLQCGRTLMYRLLKSGRVRSVKVGHLRRVPVSALDDFISTQEARAS